MKIQTTAIATVAVGLLSLAGCGNNSTCSQVDGLAVCGEFGTLTSTAALSDWGEQVRWPGVVSEGSLFVARESEMVQVSGDNANVIASFNGTLSPVSVDDQGTLYASTADWSSWSGSQVVAVDPAAAQTVVATSGTVEGDSAIHPPAIGDGKIYANTLEMGFGSPRQYTLDQNNLALLEQRGQTSQAAITPEGKRLYLEGAADCSEPHDTLVAENTEGTVEWEYTDAAGIIDFAPGAEGETYVVNGNRELVRVDETGNADWTFTPDCADCTVAAAPTITDDAVYFPVWEGWVMMDNCGNGEVPLEPDPNNDSGDFGWGGGGVDPLYALDHDGNLRWVYEGFDTQRVQFAFGFVPTDSDQITHHPAGRPVVADDGTLFVATDGAVVALDPNNGEVVGMAMYDSELGEVNNTGTFARSDNWLSGGLAPAPVLDDTGNLYVWDGADVRTFSTQKPAARIPWTAPFGGSTNDGRAR